MMGKHNSRRQKYVIAGLIAIFIVSALIRTYQPESRPNQWLLRSQNFTRAIEKQDWTETYQQYHPGFPTMAIAGMGVRFYQLAPRFAKAGGYWVYPLEMSPYGKEMMWGSVAISVIVSLAIAAMVWVLLNLADWRVAFGAGTFLALSPFYIAESRVVHVDGLMGTLMMLSALILLLYIRRRHWYLLGLSGLVGGLAILTKTPAIFLIPYLGLSLGLSLILAARREWTEKEGPGRWRWLIELTIRTAVVPFIAWLAAATLPALLWPVMWAAPGRVAELIAKSVRHATVTPHPNPRFFAGNIISDAERPSMLFYPVTLAFQQTFVTLTLALLSVGFYTVWGRRVDKALDPLSYWLVVAYLVFFLIEMGISAKQDQRYIMAADLPLQIMAGAGLAGLMKLVERAFATSRWPGDRLAQAAFSTAVVLQAGVVLVFVPDVGGHRNYLLGGNQVAVHIIEVGGDQNEGAQYLGRYVAEHADPAQIVGVTGKLGLAFNQYKLPNILAGRFDGGYDIDQIDILAFDYLTIQRNIREERWADAWDIAGSERPHVSVQFDGVEHMRLLVQNADPSLPYVVIRRGWNGFIVVAWLWTAGLIALLAIGLPRLMPTPDSPLS